MQIRYEFDLLKAGFGEQLCNRLRLAVPDFERHIAAGNERTEGGGDEAAINVESVVTGKERQRGLVLAHLDGERGAVSAGHIRRIGNDNLEALPGNRRKQIAIEKAKVNFIAFGVFTRNGQRLTGEIDRCNDSG